MRYVFVQDVKILVKIVESMGVQDVITERQDFSRVVILLRVASTAGWESTLVQWSEFIVMDKPLRLAIASSS